MTIDTTATTNAWNIVGATCDVGDGATPADGLMNCQVHSHAHGGLYRITLALTDAV